MKQQGLKTLVATMIGLGPIFSYLTWMMQIHGTIAQDSLTRFAPSPTGWLHLGHVASSIFVWGVAGRCGAKVLLRSEDHDQSRTRRAYEVAVFNDLAWLGLKHANATFNADQPADFRQSDAIPRYLAAVEVLRKNFLVYGCDCSRQVIARTMPPRPDGAVAEELCYSGRCRSRGLALDQPGVGWRVEIPEQEQTFNDLLLGPQRQVPARQCGDLLLRDRHGLFTYNFAVVVDDLKHDINLIIRGQDLTAATGRQLWLAAALGGPRRPMQFLHHPLIVDAQGQKLSKRFFAEGLAARRARGETPAQVLGLAAHLVGLQHHPSPISAAELPSLFQLEPHV